MRKLAALLLALLMLTGCATAEDAQPLYDKETAHALVEQLFAAAAGTTWDGEKSARKGLSKDERAQRDADNALYRAQVKPWLIAAFRLDDPWVTVEPAPADEPQWTLADAWDAMQGNSEGQAYLALAETLGAADMESCLTVTRQVCQQWLAEVDHAALVEQNGDYACWLYAADMPIDYPVVQCANNDYYLDHLFNGKKNASGTLFIDYRNLPGFADPNTLVYGHHMRNQGMFGQLDEYAAQAFFEGHPYMLLLSSEGVRLVEIFAAYTTSSADHCYDIAISDDADMQAFIDTALKKSNIDTGVQVALSDHLITMSTCAYSFDNARFIAIGRIEDVWMAQDAAKLP